MKPYEKVYESLKMLDIYYELVEHPPALTSEEADSYIEGKEGVRTKTMLLCNKKKTAYYLLILDDQKRIDMKGLGELLGEKSMQFASEARLMEKMKLTSGSVSIFGLLNNEEKDIKIYFDKEIMGEAIMTFHPNDNTKTLFLATLDVCRFIEKTGFSYDLIEL